MVGLFVISDLEVPNPELLQVIKAIDESAITQEAAESLIQISDFHAAHVLLAMRAQDYLMDLLDTRTSMEGGSSRTRVSALLKKGLTASADSEAPSDPVAATLETSAPSSEPRAPSASKTRKTVSKSKSKSKTKSKTVSARQRSKTLKTSKRHNHSPLTTFYFLLRELGFRLTDEEAPVDDLVYLSNLIIKAYDIGLNNPSLFNGLEIFFLVHASTDKRNKCSCTAEIMEDILRNYYGIDSIAEKIIKANPVPAETITELFSSNHGTQEQMTHISTYMDKIIEFLKVSPRSKTLSKTRRLSKTRPLSKTSSHGTQGVKKTTVSL
jgi:hypothetical protein